eukprot:6178299-Pleurochrysis_carterae.AAC.1
MMTPWLTRSYSSYNVSDRMCASVPLCLSVPPLLDLYHVYLRSLVDQVGACDLDDLVRDVVLLDSTAPERSSPARTLHPFTPLITPPLTEPFPPPKL